MKKLMGIVLLGTVINSAHAQEFLEFGVEDYQAKESKWQFDVGINYLQYPTNLPDFKGEYYTNREVENFEVYGPSIGFGRDFHIVAGLSVSAKAGGFFYWTFNNETGQASRDIDIELASNRRNHRIYGANASMSLNYIFEGKNLDFQPFIIGAVGVGRGEVEREYKYMGLDDSEGTQEENRELYDVKLEDTFSYREAGIGMNFITKRGIVTFIKASRTILAINDRTLEGRVKRQGGTEEKIKESGSQSKEYEVTSATVGLGFMF